MRGADDHRLRRPSSSISLRSLPMPLGPNLWNASALFYESLTLSANGHEAEKVGVAIGLTSAFPNYEIFWKRHVCPATNRPNGITFRPNVADIISVIAQRNYTIFVYLLDALEMLSKINRDD